MERKSELTKALLGEKFKELVAKKGFEKLTIKMITDAAGVIRPTFYNYFQDKYEVMEWLLETEVFQHIREMTEDGMEREAIYLLFRKMEKDRIYFFSVRVNRIVPALTKSSWEMNRPLCFFPFTVIRSV